MKPNMALPPPPPSSYTRLPLPVQKITTLCTVSTQKYGNSMAAHEWGQNRTPPQLSGGVERKTGRQSDSQCVGAEEEWEWICGTTSSADLFSVFIQMKTAGLTQMERLWWNGESTATTMALCRNYVVYDGGFAKDYTHGCAGLTIGRRLPASILVVCVRSWHVEFYNLHIQNQKEGLVLRWEAGHVWKQCSCTITQMFTQMEGHVAHTMWLSSNGNKAWKSSLSHDEFKLSLYYNYYIFLFFFFNLVFLKCLFQRQKLVRLQRVSLLLT